MPCFNQGSIFFDTIYTIPQIFFRRFLLNSI